MEQRSSSLRVLVAFLLAGFVGQAASQAQDKPDFEKDIWPFVKNSCVGCHKPAYKDERGRTRRPKAGLVVTNKEAFLRGGESGEVVVAGKPEDSSFLQRVLLPIDHDEHMPPEGKADQWTEAQVKLFEKWIAAGADFGDWTRDPEVDKGD